MNTVGGATSVSRSDGSSATLTQIGGTTFMSDSRPGMSGTANQIDGTTFINRGDGNGNVRQNQIGGSIASR